MSGHMRCFVFTKQVVGGASPDKSNAHQAAKAATDDNAHASSATHASSNGAALPPTQPQPGGAYTVAPGTLRGMQQIQPGNGGEGGVEQEQANVNSRPQQINAQAQALGSGASGVGRGNQFAMPTNILHPQLHHQYQNNRHLLHHQHGMAAGMMGQALGMQGMQAMMPALMPAPPMRAPEHDPRFAAGFGFAPHPMMQVLRLCLFLVF